MNIQPSQAPNSVYLFNPNIDHNQLFNAMSACLSKAEALALTAATADFDGKPLIIPPKNLSNNLINYHSV